MTRFIIADIKYTTTSTGVGYGSGFELTKDTPYLALTGELWDVFCEYFDEKRSCYKGVLLYHDRLRSRLDYIFALHVYHVTTRKPPTDITFCG